MRFNLNPQQESIANKAKWWFKYSSEQTFSITGGAGTGKSYLLAAILERLNLKDDEILPMAYTGQACSVMRKHGLPSACTCHSGLFSPVKCVEHDIYGQIKMNKQFNVPIVKWNFIPKDFTDSKIKLIILDEAFMIPLRFKKFIDATGIKVSATGDPGQLPPVADEPAYLIDGNVYHLTELMRQSENSPIVYLANRARNGLPIETGFYGNSVLVIYDDELNDDMLARSSMILCGKNNTREIINNHIRKNILKINVDYPLMGERIICRKNNWDFVVDGIPLVNGLVGTVITPPSIDRFDGELLILDFKPDILNLPFNDVKVNYKYLNASNKEKESLKINPYLQGERFEFSYASTVHLSQGSEYDCGIYLEEFMNKNLQNALNYTGITRFKQKMIYVKKRPKTWNFYNPSNLDINNVLL